VLRSQVVARVDKPMIQPPVPHPKRPAIMVTRSGSVRFRVRLRVGVSIAQEVGTL
jgi:hypothetical protein